MPPPDLAAEIDEIRKEFATNFGCKAALKPPVHITVYPPFEDLPDLASRVHDLHGWAARQRSFHILLDGYGSFVPPHSSPVLYIAPAPNKELANFHLRFMAIAKKYVRDTVVMRGYKPHITIGYRDIPKEAFPEIMDSYRDREFKASFVMNSLYLWTHDTKKWQVTDEYKLGPLPSEPQHIQGSLF